MNVRHSGFAVLAGLTLSSISCSKMSSGISPEPTTVRFVVVEPPLYLVDNIEISNLKQAQDIIKARQGEIKSIHIFKPNSLSSSNDLVSTYGSKAKNGVIQIVTK